ncbi:MAG: helix-turn-helix domain-containing protein [Candidatus Thermoplasmatota archaeon]|nr:helix-turn-helix domain-containing protein [Candidatus Thermoplasmatota archaeon]
MKVPCEIIVWEILPIIRKEFAKSLIKDHGLTQRKAAEKLGLTEASVSRYISGKRGEIKKLNKEIMQEIQKSTTRICKGDSLILVEEICRICDLFKSNGLIDNINNTDK